MTILMQNEAGDWTPTQWWTWRRLKNWATRQKFVYRMDRDVLIVSKPDGSILRYKQAKSGK